MVLFPVVVSLGTCASKFKGKEKVAYLSRVARQALEMSAARSGLVLGALLKDEDGVPCPVNGNYWSLSHKPGCVAAVVSQDKVGIDIEEIKPRSETLFSCVATEEEWQLSEKSWHTLFRYWTAKEATLKALGIGISGLKTCRIASVLDEAQIVLDYEGRHFLVEQLIYRNHVVSVVKGGHQVDWTLLETFPSHPAYF